MRFSQFLIPAACLCAAVTAQVAQAAPEPAEIIAKARAKVATEDKLASVKSIQLVGNVSDKDGKEVAQQMTTGKLPDMWKEYMYGGNSGMEHTRASNGLEGYAKIKRGATGQMQPVSSREIKSNTDRLQAEIGFFAAPVGGSVTYDGEVLQQGKSCYVLVYKYKGGTHYRRFFDKLSGQYVAHEVYSEADTPQNQRVLVVAEGELFVDSVRFPKKLVHFRDGKKEFTIDYTKITLNPADVTDADFAFPMP